MGESTNVKQQVIIIHGGDTHRTYRGYLAFLKKQPLNYTKLVKGGWKDHLQKELGRRFEVVQLKMPNPLNARYVEWKIMFRKLIPFLKGRPILVGHSLGSIFLAKYLSENKFPKKVRATLLVAAPYNNDLRKSSHKQLRADFALPKSLARFEKQGGKIFLYQSKDDPVVPFSHFEKYEKALTRAQGRIFKNRSHFGQEKFPELARTIKKLSK